MGRDRGGHLAYLVGSVTQLATEWAERLWRTRFSRRERWIELPSQRAIEEKWDATRARLERADPMLVGQEPLTERGLKARSSAGYRAEQELNLPATVLVGADPTPYAEVDRLRAEGDLRLTVAPPLVAAITSLLALVVSPWFLLGLVGIGALVIQGAARKSESRNLIVAAMSAGRLDSPAVRDFETVMDGYLKEAEEAFDRNPIQGQAAD